MYGFSPTSSIRFASLTQWTREKEPQLAPSLVRDMFLMWTGNEVSKAGIHASEVG